MTGAPAGPGARIEVRSPYDGSLLDTVPRHTEADIDAAVAVARACHHAGPPPAHQRAAVLDRAAALLAEPERTEAFARTIATEAAKPIRTARAEVARAVETFRFAAATARTLTGETVPLEATAVGEGKFGFVLRVPIGVVAAISPFNFPLNLVAHKVAPGIAAGCPVVLKPASATPLSALALARLLTDECGLPEGWLQVITCGGAVADHLVTHPDVAYITFTGSPEVGWGIRARAPRAKVGLELGNNAPVLIEPSARLDEAAAKIAVAGFSHAGQSCISVQRVLVHRDVAAPFEAALAERVQALVVGPPLDEATDVSALISPAETERVASVIADAVVSGARIVCGGDRTPDGILRPTVLGDASPSMEVCRTEVFGPVVALTTYDRFDEGLALANDTRYGLQAGVFTADLATALEAARRLDFGGVMVNEVPTWRADQMPYGGRRDSGNTREGPRYAAFEMTEPRLIVVAP